MINSNQLEDLKCFLSGGCKTISEAMEILFGLEEDVLTEEQIEDIDQDIFRCAECGWWYEISEDSGSDDSELICNNCND